MAQFAWKGIGLDGLDKSGVQKARSCKQLDALLLSQNIALLEASVIAPYSRLRPVSLSLRTTFFDQLATLLEAGVYLDAALAILAEQTAHAGFASVINDIASSVQEGSQFHEALDVYKDLFDTVIISVVRSGQEVGNLPVALRSIAKYLAFREQFKATIKRVCMLPLITCLFFLVVAVIIIGFIVPSFASLYQSAGKELPATTQTLLWLSSWVSLAGLALLVPFFVVLYLCVRVLKRSYKVMRIYEAVLLNVPIIGRIIGYGNLLSYMQALAILSAGGVHVAQALKLALGAISVTSLHDTFIQVHYDVQHGKHVSVALKQSNALYGGPSVLALLRVGEESGRLDRAFEQVVVVYQQQLEKTSNLVTTLIQPLLMIALGLMITGLIFAVYVPIFNLSEVIS
ncbi:MAG: type II secretion system F family protein [Candidatus Babeliales bacterium]